MAKVGRPVTKEFSIELAQEICDVIATSTKSLESLVKEHPNWPKARLIYYWLHRYPEFVQLYARAKEEQANAIAEEILEIADDESKDIVECKDGTLFNNASAVPRARLRIDARKWYAAKLRPQVWGEPKEKNKDDDDAISKVRVED